MMMPQQQQPSMKLLWVFSSFGLGGPQQRFAALAGRLGDAYEHVVCAMDGDYEAERLIPGAVRWRRLAFRAKSAKSRVSLTTMWSVRKALQAERPHLVLTSNVGAIDWLLANRGPGAAPHLHFEDPYGQDERLDADQDARSWARRRAFPGKERAFVAPSREIEQLFVELWGAPEAAVRRIPNGYDLRGVAAIERSSRRKPLTIGSVGPLVRHRRVDRLLRLGATLVERGRDVRLLILGDGPERAALTREAAALKLADRVRFAGASGELDQAYAAIDVYAVTSERERSQRGLIMAMGAGLPIVGADVGEVAETIDAANAIFVRPPEDESAMAAAAELLCADSGLRLGLGKANRERAIAHFDDEIMARRYDALFREIVGRTSMLMLPAPGETVAAAAVAAVAAPNGAGEPAAPRRDQHAPQRLSRPHGWGAAAAERAPERKTSKRKRGPGSRDVVA